MKKWLENGWHDMAAVVMSDIRVFFVQWSHQSSGGCPRTQKARRARKKKRGTLFLKGQLRRENSREKKALTKRYKLGERSDTFKSQIYALEYVHTELYHVRASHVP